MGIDYDDLSRKQYRKNIDEFKPDHASYNAQRSKTSSASTSAALVAQASGASGSEREIQEATADLYRDANTFIYADHVPSEDAIDRVVGKINLEYAGLILLILIGVMIIDVRNNVLMRTSTVLLSELNSQENDPTKLKETLPTSTRRIDYTTKR